MKLKQVCVVCRLLAGNGFLLSPWCTADHLCFCCCLPPLQVLTIGATNLAQELDQALLRPGRFEVSKP